MSAYDCKKIGLRGVAEESSSVAKAYSEPPQELQIWA